MLGLIGAAVLMIPVIVKAQADNPMAPPSADESQSQVSGQVTEKSDGLLTIDAKTTIGLNDSTAFIRDGQAIKLDDIKVGDRVRVTTTQGMGGDLLASQVEVIASE